MAQDVGYDFAAGPTVTLLSADLSDTVTSALTATVDFGDPTPLGFGYELIVTGQGSADEFAFLEVVWSHDNSDFSDENVNFETVTSINCAASADRKKIGSSEIKARYAKFQLNNQTGGTIDGTSSNTALVLFDIFLNQV